MYAFAAAALGGFDSPLGAVVGGLIVGVADTLDDAVRPRAATTSSSSCRSGSSCVVLLFRPVGAVRHDARGARVMHRSAAQLVGARRSPSRSSLSCSCSSLVHPADRTSRPTTQLWAQALYIGVAAMGLNLLTGYNGQVSIGHGAFFGVGTYTTAILMDHEHGWQLPSATAFVATLPSSPRLVRRRRARRLPRAAREGPVPRARHARARGAVPRPHQRASCKGTGGTNLVSLTPREAAPPGVGPDQLVAPRSVATTSGRTT